MKRLAIGVAAALSLVLSTAACTSGDRSDGTTVDPDYTPGEVSTADYARALFDLTNVERAELGLSQLTWSDCLADAASPRAATASATEALEHEILISPCQDEGVTVENLSRLAGTPQTTIEAWMASPSHEANIVRPDLLELGITCVYPSDAVADAVTCSWLAQGPLA